MLNGWHEQGKDICYNSKEWKEIIGRKTKIIYFFL